METRTDLNVEEHRIQSPKQRPWRHEIALSLNEWLNWVWVLMSWVSNRLRDLDNRCTKFCSFVAGVIKQEDYQPRRLLTDRKRIQLMFWNEKIKESVIRLSLLVLSSSLWAQELWKKRTSGRIVLVYDHVFIVFWWFISQGPVEQESKRYKLCFVKYELLLTACQFFSFIWRFTKTDKFVFTSSYARLWCLTPGSQG